MVSLHLMVSVEPYWNLNKDDEAKKHKAIGVSVEPYWNLNPKKIG